MRSMKSWICGDHALPLGQRTWVMGIVNATPDSFGGEARSGEPLLNRALRLLEEGADLLDIGGESTRPGAQPVSAAEELDRVLPLLAGLRATGALLCVDTTKASVAKAALEAGAGAINDISGGTFDAEMLATVAPYPCGLVLMHLRGGPATMKWSQSSGTTQGDVVAEVLSFWRQRVEAAAAAGIAPERIALDAGFGFGKSLNENLELLRRGRELAAFGFPTLSGTSRKSTIGRILDDVPAAERLWGTAATVTLAIANGAEIIRVHDVAEMRQVARVADAVTR